MELDTVTCCDAIDLLRQQPKESVRLIIADPPYGIGYHSNHYKGKNPHSPIANDWNFEISLFLAECDRVLSADGALYLFARWDVTPLWLPHIGGDLKVKTAIVWMKDNWSAGDLTGSFGNQYEQILFITKSDHKLRGHRWSNVWQFARIPSKRLIHPAQKPVEMLMRAIQSSSDEGDTVIDPFAGSGSTGEAAQRAGRHFILGDIDPRMVALTSQRLGLSSLNVENEPPQIEQAYKLSVPDSSEWGIHPEDLLFIREELNGNVEREFKQLDMYAVLP